MATQGNQIHQTFVATAVLPQYTFVTATGTSNDGATPAVGATAANGKADGVLINAPIRANTAATVVTFGRTKVVAGGAIAAGAEIQVGANGRAVAATGTNIRVGKALEAGVNNQIITVDFYQGGNAA